MNALDALSKMVSQVPGGRAAVAARIGISVKVLEQKFSVKSAHKMGLVEAEEIARICHEMGAEDSYALASVFAFGAGRFLVIPDDGVEASIQVSTARTVHEAADVLTAVTRAVSDEFVSDNDKKEVLKEAMQLMAAVQDLVGSLRAQHAADKAAREGDQS